MTRGRTATVRPRRCAKIGGLLVLAPMAALGTYIFLRSIDPPWQVREIGGEVLNSGFVENPSRTIDVFKMKLLIRTDDGRTIGAASSRATAPRVGTRVRVQERIGLAGTRRFVELPDR